ncbi:unnamed protein product [Protopolystoma xenopodis]|uniref:Uncharacterized protein n=1 Tax=Protopolystoma xenopodis TaxID=117903 RepID=A0A3S5A854_9PLAT|nr:unnamed protein product [Protopolystoma xenopodis]
MCAKQLCVYFDAVGRAHLSGIHENPPHSTLAFSPPFTLVLGMLMRVCHIVTQSSFYRSYLSPSCPVRSVCSLPGSHISLNPCHPICATRGVIRHPLRLGDYFEAQVSE